MRKIRLMTLLGTRPEIIRLSAIIRKCDRYFEQILVHTGQNYDYNLRDVFFRDLKVRAPDYQLDVVGPSLGETMGSIVAQSYRLMAETRPDALLVLGGTNSCLAAISAKRLQIPVFHMDAGTRCFDQRLPEEINHRIADHMADINLCDTEQARRNLMAEGVPPDRVFVVGSPMAEVLRANLEAIENSQILKKLGLAPRHYILLSAHREENIDTEANFRALFSSVNVLAQTYNLPILYSCHPRSRKKLEERQFPLDFRVRLHEPLGFHDYNNLQMNAFCVVSDSVTLPEEAAFFAREGHHFPAVCLRTGTERPEALEKGRFILAGITPGGVEQAVSTAVLLQENGDFGQRVPEYQEDVSVKVIKLIQSGVGMVNTQDWRKPGGGPAWES